MKTRKLIQSLGLAAVMAVSAGAFGNDEYRPDFNNGPAFNSHPVFRESLRLMDEQREINRMERAFLADGLLTRFEYRRLDATLDAASRDIFRESRDGHHGNGWKQSHGYGGQDR